MGSELAENWQRAAIAAEVLPMFQEETRKRQGQRTDLEHLDQKTQKSPDAPATVTRARDEAAAMMNVSPASVERYRTEALSTRRKRRRVSL